MATLQRLLVSLGMDEGDFTNSIGRAERRLSRFRSDVDATSKKVASFGKSLSRVGKYAAFASLANSASGLTAAVVPAAGALWMLPGAAAAGGAAMGTLAVATSGFGDALSNMDDPEKFAESVAQLSPNAAAAAREVRALSDEWSGLADSVQQSAFAGVSGEIETLGSTYIPVLNTGMTALAGSFNDAAMEASGFLQQAQTVSDVEAILADTQTTLDNTTDAVEPLLSALRDIAAVGSSVLADVTGGAGDAAQRFADFVSAARESGQLEEWMHSGLETLRQLGTIAGNVGSGLKAMLSAADASGGDFLATLVQLSDQFATWANSAEGQEQLAQVFQVLQMISGHLATMLPIVASAVADVVSWFTALPAPVQQVVTGFLAASLVAGVLIKKFSPLIAVLGRLGGAFLTSATTQGKAVNRILKGLDRLKSAIGAATASVARFTARVAARFAVMAARAIAKTTIMAARVTAQFVLMASRALAQMTVMAARVVAQWAIMAAGAMARAVVMAASWLVAMGPVGWVIAAVIALVALIIANWDRVKRWTVKAWRAVSDWVAKAWGWIVDTVTGAGRAVWRAVRNAFQSAYDWAVRKAAELVVWVRGLPDRILSALGNLGSLLLDAGRDIIRGLWDGIKSMAGWVGRKIKGLVSNIVPGPVADVLGISSPSKVMAELGQWVPEGLAVGIDANTGSVEAATRDMASAAATMPTPEPRSAREQDTAVSPELLAALRQAVTEGMPDELVIDRRGGRVLAHVVNDINASDRRR
ncbi:phage tail protein [Actinopolyspora alba]|uniref:phage tail protein n=1 Tax=Actinopolyspora alba TaxID=673379 RepID=UPI00111395E9|nr:hypothetical protein [Actinopolyspora alba]